jgi:hypothetical protein
VPIHGRKLGTQVRDHVGNVVVLDPAGLPAAEFAMAAHCTLVPTKAKVRRNDGAASPASPELHAPCVERRHMQPNLPAFCMPLSPFSPLLKYKHEGRRLQDPERMLHSPHERFPDAWRSSTACLCSVVDRQLSRHA